MSNMSGLVCTFHGHLHTREFSGFVLIPLFASNSSILLVLLLCMPSIPVTLNIRRRPRMLWVWIPAGCPPSLMGSARAAMHAWPQR